MAAARCSPAPVKYDVPLEGTEAALGRLGMQRMKFADSLMGLAETVVIVEVCADAVSRVLCDAHAGNLAPRPVWLGKRGRVPQWDKKFGLGIEKSQPWVEMSALINIRNAAMHGLGALTDRQGRREFVAAVAPLGAALESGKVVLPYAMGDTAIRVADRFVRHLDDRARWWLRANT